MRNMIPNPRVTKRKVPSDWVSVVTIICFPVFLIFFQTSSVPISSPTAHSMQCMMILYHSVLRTVSLISERACGPSIIPVSSQPSIAGSLSFEISLPAANAITMAAVRRSIFLYLLYNPIEHKIKYPCKHFFMVADDISK